MAELNKNKLKASPSLASLESCTSISLATVLEKRDRKRHEIDIDQDSARIHLTLRTNSSPSKQSRRNAFADSASNATGLTKACGSNFALGAEAPRNASSSSKGQSGSAASRISSRVGILASSGDREGVPEQDAVGAMSTRWAARSFIY